MLSKLPDVLPLTSQVGHTFLYFWFVIALVMQKLAIAVHTGPFKHASSMSFCEIRVTWIIKNITMKIIPELRALRRISKKRL